ncbi:type I restriction-modification system, S subunit [Spirochaetia bacterium]|nr:type I restriction-modification system, S subunit [Spirochaetia bacterium]
MVTVPEGWENALLEDVAIIGDGLHGTPNYDDSGEYFFVNGNNLRNGKIYTDENTKRVNKYTYESLQIDFSQKTVFMSINGTIGNVARFYGERIAIGKSVAYFNVKNAIQSSYLFFQLQNSQLLKYFEDTLTGSTIRNLGLNIIRNAKIFLPPLPEQHAIAEALSDMDSYIASLEKLIDKKKAIKQGAMQKLLTGKRRLPGFSGEWNEKTLSATLDIGHGQNQKGIEKPGGKYPILGTGGEMGRTDYHLYNSPSVLIGRKGTIDNPQYIDIPFWTIDTLFYTIIHEGFSPKYFYYAFCMIDWSKYNEASGVPSLSRKTIGEITVTLPEHSEQAAIAAILSDMDAEIEALAAKLNKAKSIKQGMMQELLTGRIRLVKPQVITVPVTKVVDIPKQEKAAKGHNQEIEDAVILSTLAGKFGTEQYPFTAFDCQKFPYLFRRHVEGITKGYEKFAAGPYNPGLKYRTARPIALKRRYIRECTGLYKGFVTDVNVQEALDYFAKWYGDEPLQWLEQFRYIKNRRDELELLTTVDMAMVELRDNNKPITVSSVKEIIQNSDEWKAKLKREIFSDENITRAIKWSMALFGEDE